MSAISEDYIKIQNSLSLTINDNLLIDISKILQYRKKIAIEINKCSFLEKESYKQLLEVYEYSNQKLKQLLNL